MNVLMKYTYLLPELCVATCVAGLNLNHTSFGIYLCHQVQWQAED